MYTLKTVVWMQGKRKSFGFFSFLLAIVRSCQNDIIPLQKNRVYNETITAIRTRH